MERALNATASETDRLIVLSVRANHMAGKGLDFTEATRVLDREILDLLDSGANGRVVEGEWFERVADETRDDGEAVGFYRLGLKWVWDWHQFWIKAPGAAVLAGQDVDWMSDVLEEYTQKRSARLNERFTSQDMQLYILSQCDKRFKPNPKVWVKKRWNAGIGAIDRLWGGSNVVRRAIRALRAYELPTEVP